MARWSLPLRWWRGSGGAQGAGGGGGPLFKNGSCEVVDGHFLYGDEGK